MKVHNSEKKNLLYYNILMPCMYIYECYVHNYDKICKNKIERKLVYT